MYYFLPDDLREFDRQMEKLAGDIREAGQDMGKSCEQGAETYHDNAPYEEAVRSFAMSSWRLSELQDIRRQARVISSPTTTDRVMVGVKVKIKDLDTGEEKTFRVGSFFTFSPDEISYGSPLAKMLIGASIGEERQGRIGDREKRFQILAISP